MSKLKGILKNEIKANTLNSKDKLNRREWLKMVLPGQEKISSAILRLDSSQCTGCILCSLECPTKALTSVWSSETDSHQLLFQHGLCNGCEQCVVICPEHCLYLDKIPEPEKPENPVVSLFEDAIVRCRECGEMIGSRAMIEGIQDKLHMENHALPSQLGLCPTCKIKNMSLGRVTFELAENQPRTTSPWEKG